jgi:predicted nucleic acid-binding protein
MIALRAADALHLALAASAGTGTLLTFDPRLADAALAIGIEVRP